MRRAGWHSPYAQTHPPFVIRLSFQPSTATDIPTEPRTSRDVYSLSKRYRKMMSEQPQEVARERVESPVKSFRALKKPIWAGRQQTRVSAAERTADDLASLDQAGRVPGGAGE